MSNQVSPEAHWGRDNSDSLILQEQAKSLPASLTGTGDVAETIDDQVRDACGKSPTELLQRLADCERDGKTYLEIYVNPARVRSHKAYRNEHFDQSKYLSARYKTRSKLFKPKTRNAVRKNMASAAAALFASADIVSVEAQDNSSPQQNASAALNRELLNYRLDRTNGRDSIPWFLVCMGANQDAQLDGVCASKQYWKFHEVMEDPDPNEAPVEPVFDELGQEIPQEPKTFITADRPDVLNIPPENIIFDPNAEWTRPAQTSSYLVVRYAMPIHEIMEMMEPNEFSGRPRWIEHTREEIETIASVAPQDAQTIRNARSGGADGNQQNLTGTNRVVWVYENFISIKGKDYNFWSIGTQKLLSIPQTTRKAYPWAGGERPYIVGFGAIETHRPLPMAPAEAWQQLQQEANDVTNLRLDQMKQVVTPITKVKRGRQIDLEQVFRRGQDTAVMVMDMEDVEFDRPPDVPPSAFQETSLLNNDFDELAGTFSNASVQSNRELNDTVGGMKLMSQGANSLTEFDLRVWIETWVEPVLWQLIKLEQFYESDTKILALAGQKAELVEQFGQNEITDQLLMQDVTVRVAAGLGTADPMQKLEKLAIATKTVLEPLMPFVEMGAIKLIPKADELINEAYGAAGWKDAAERFWEVIPVDPNAPPPEVQAQQAQAEADQAAAQAQMEQEAAMQEQQMAMEADQADKQMAAQEAEAQRQMQMKQQLEAEKAAKEIAADIAKREEAERKHAENLAKIEADKQVRLAEIAAKQQEAAEKRMADERDRNEKRAADERDRGAEREFRRELEFEKLGVQLHSGDQERQSKERIEGARLDSANENASAALESKENIEAARAKAQGAPVAKKSGSTNRKPLENQAEKAFTQAFKSVEGGLSDLAKTMAEMMKAMNAPKEISLKKGANGIEGATIRPAA